MYVIGTAGHVDHGKSLLVEALTGIDPDRLREEKQRGMTIDLGFAWLTLPSGRSVSIVDVPGHERFIKNMLAGAGGIDVALLVVAADDGVMPQTREHLAILDLLDVRRAVVAITKRDLVDDDWLALIETDIATTLEGTTIASAPIVACSSLTGAGLDELRAALDEALDALPPKRDIGRPRLPIDRVFTIGGFGTVVTGTLIDGELAPGVEIEASPGRLRGRIRGLQTHGAAVERAQPGTRTAVNISGITKDELRRGMVLVLPGTLRPTDVVDARVRAVGTAAHALRHDMRLSCHSGADEQQAVLRLLELDELRPGDETWAQIKLDATMSLVRGDRFVLRTPDDTVAGGLVVDTAPKRHRRRHAPTIAALEALLSDAPADIVYDTARRNPLLDEATLASESGLPPPEVAGALVTLVGSGRVTRFGDAAEARYATSAWARDVEQRVHDAVASYHVAHPLRAGMPQEELRSRLGIDAKAFTLLIAACSPLHATGPIIALTSFAPRPTAEQHAQIERYLASLSAPADQRPTAPALDPSLHAYLVETGAVVDAGDGIVFDAAVFASMREHVRAHITQHGSITLAHARDIFGTSRKSAQAALEQLDRERVTRRVGDERVLRE